MTARDVLAGAPRVQLQARKIYYRIVGFKKDIWEELLQEASCKSLYCRGVESERQKTC